MCDLSGLKETANLMRGELQGLREVIPLSGEHRKQEQKQGQGNGQGISQEAEEKIVDEIRGV